MSSRTIHTCDICGKDIEPVYPIMIGCGERVYTPYSLGYNWAEKLVGDACHTCLRRFVEDIRSKTNLKYTIAEGK